MSESHNTQQSTGLQNTGDVTLRHENSPTEPPDPKRARTKSPSLSLSHKLKAIVIALCCHHRCSWSQLVGTEWLSSCGFSPIDVHLITKMTSWAVCGVRGPGKRDEETCDVDHEPPPYVSTDTATSSDIAIATNSTHSLSTTTTNSVQSLYPAASSTPSLKTNSTHPHDTMTTSPAHSLNTVATTSSHSSYHPHPREATGILCKRFLDLARLHYLRDWGLEARLVYFVSRETSLENVLLIGTPPVLDT